MAATPHRHSRRVLLTVLVDHRSKEEAIVDDAWFEHLLDALVSDSGGPEKIEACEKTEEDRLITLGCSHVDPRVVSVVLRFCAITFAQHKMPNAVEPDGVMRMALETCVRTLELGADRSASCQLNGERMPP